MGGATLPTKNKKIMATANFSKKNASEYFVFTDEGAESFIDLMRHSDEDKSFPYSEDVWCSKMKARKVRSSAMVWQTFGNGRAWNTETGIESAIYIRGGYYSGAVLDYDVKIMSCDGDVFRLSKYDALDDLLDDYLDCVENLIAWRGAVHYWTIGTFKLHKENLRKWITKRIKKQVEVCEEFCKNHCDHILEVYANFSNGETLYTKVG